MTAPRDPDDLASALLDGVLTDDEAAVARQDPAVIARLAEFEAARDAVAGPPPAADPAVRERTLAAALAAFDAEDDRPTPAPVTAEPTGPPWRTEGRWQRRWLAAAAVLLAVVGVGALARGWDRGGDDADNAATGAQDSGGGDESSGSGGGAESGERNQGPAVGGGGAAAVVDLGEIESEEALADRVRAAGDERPAPDPTSGADDGDEGAVADEESSDQDSIQLACGAGGGRGLAGPGTVVLEGRATLAGEPVDVYVLQQTDGSERLIAVDASCTVVVDRSLDG